MKLKWMGVGLLFTATAFAAMEGGGGFMEAMDASMKKMDRDMAAAPMNGNADHDFAAMMIPHHQGAIDMAEGELKYGTDPAMRQFAQKIITDQKAEIAFMRDWLKKNSER